MTEGLLRNRLEPVASRRRQLRFWRRLSIGWAAAALLALAVFALQSLLGWASLLTLPVIAVLGAIIAVVIAVTGRERTVPLRAAAEDVERQFPDLDGLLLTAVQQQGAKDAPLGYLQRCVLRDAVAHSRSHEWTSVVPGSRIAVAQLAQAATLVLFLGALWTLRTPGNPLTTPLFVRTDGVTVTPGDTTLERGQSLVVLARFGSTPPANAELVIGGTPATERRIPLTRSLSDPVFGGSVPEVSQEFTYRIEYGGERTRDFAVKVFDFPRLERADAELTFPEYTRQAARRIENTRRVTAVEGTRIDLALHLNKPVVSATLTSRNPGHPSLPLEVAPDKPAAALTNYALAHKGAYDLQLVDTDGRTNKVPAQFFFEALPNRVPELKLLAPRGDIRPSALEEVYFDGTVWDDFGVIAHGIGLTLVGKEAEVIELGREIPASERRPFKHVLRLEDLGVQPDQLVSWYLWADDIGPDGNVRRTEGDLLFAEIRPFEEIFREGSGNEGEPEQGQGEGGGGNQTQELVRLQKQIVSATWNLQRATREATPKYKDDVQVIRDSQTEAIQQAEAAAEQNGDPRSRGLWDAVIEDMGSATVRLGDARESLAALPPALSAEQSAYQNLLKLQARETEVARSRRGQGQGGGGRNQEQLDQLELTQAENRYETQRQAQSPTTPERREQLQVLNRLQELARRQEDLNERLQELQTALQQAATEQEREELRRQLKRLQEEQEQMLADLDELNQRTQRPENQSRMSEMRQRLEQTREDMQRANEAAGQGEVSQALASGTRAQRQLQTLRDEVRKENSSQFADDLRDMRADARELERAQEELLNQLNARDPGTRRTLGSPDQPEDLVERVGAQRARMTNLVDRATQLSQAAESSEPLVAEQLYETLRQLNQEESLTLQQLQQELIERGRMTRSLFDSLRQTAESESAKALEATEQMLRQGYESEAGQAAERAQANIQTLRRGVERAAQSVLGDDTAALQLARDELDALAQQLEQEMNQAGSADRQASNEGSGTDPNSPGESSAENAEPGETQGRQFAQNGAGQQQQDQAQAGAQGNEPGQTPGSGTGERESESGQPGSRGEAQGQASQSGQQPGQQPGEGQGEGQGRGSQQLAQNQQGQGQGQGQGQAQGEGEGQGQGRGQGQNQGQAQDATGQRPGRGRQQAGATSGRGSGPGGFELDQLLGGVEGGGGGRSGTGPITSEEGFGPWSDRLREVEELIDLPELRDAVATARERARLERREMRQAQKKPDWAVVKLEILRPLVEVRRELDAELVRRSSEDSLLPIDRDPVPTRFSDLVRRYYEELGKDR